VNGEKTRASSLQGAQRQSDRTKLFGKTRDSRKRIGRRMSKRGDLLKRESGPSTQLLESTQKKKTVNLIGRPEQPGPGELIKKIPCGGRTVAKKRTWVTSSIKAGENRDVMLEKKGERSGQKARTGGRKGH